MQRMHKWPLAIVLCLVGLSSLAWSQEKQANNRPASPPNDLEFVDRVLASRRAYQHSLEQLRQHYKRTGDVERVRWVEEELMSYHRISKRAYRLDLDVPPPTLQPVHNVTEANELYRQAMTYKDKGYFNEHDDNTRRAEILYQQLLSNYPQSDKIDDAAYQLGEIYESRVFKQYRRAAQYYERCFQWNPNTQFDARLRAARLYDRTLQERARAIQLYRDIVTHETDPKRLEEAKKRLTALSNMPP